MFLVVEQYIIQVQDTTVTLNISARIYFSDAVRQHQGQQYLECVYGFYATLRLFYRFCYVLQRIPTFISY